MPPIGKQIAEQKKFQRPNPPRLHSHPSTKRTRDDAMQSIAKSAHDPQHRTALTKHNAPGNNKGRSPIPAGKTPAPDLAGKTASNGRKITYNKRKLPPADNTIEGMLAMVESMVG